MKILVTGGAGFIGSHVAEFYAKRCDEVTVIDNLSRPALLKREIKNFDYNWRYLGKYKNVRLVKADINEQAKMQELARDADAMVHTAAQTAVTTSVTDPQPDFQSNAAGTFSVLEAARKSPTCKAIVYCSTNKVYGDNPNSIPVRAEGKRYVFSDPKYAAGIPESFSIDHCEHTPYGCSKLTADLYMQDYARLYGLKTGVFRMSCIYGTRQLGVEDQGWVAHFVISTILGKPLTIYGDGKQVRDVLFVTDLVEAYDSFLSNKGIRHGVFNTGGGIKNTMSLLELQDMLEEFTGKRSKTSFSGWRPSDQKVYISDIRKAEEKLGWKPRTSPREGVKQLCAWVNENKGIFA